MRIESQQPEPSAADRRPRRPRARRWVLRCVLIGLALATMTLIPPGCGDPLQKYRVMSTFFDGVPPPEGYRLANIPDEFRGEGAVRRPEDGLVQAQDKINYRYHAPYVKRQCFECHDERSGYQAQVAGVESCQKCHEPYFQIAKSDWVHGPAAMLECRLCHQAHRSPYDGLLTEPQPDICYKCHDSAWFSDDPFHRTINDLTCSNCHDPHAAGNRLLLVDARSFERRSKIRHQAGSEHPTWNLTECSQCHMTDESNRLIDNIDKACATCHEDHLVETDQPLHKAVTELQCTVCHTAHKSPRPNLIRPTAERVCFKCHKREEIQTLAHPNVTHVDCLACHTGHREERPHMLREGIGVPGEPSVRLPSAVDELASKVIPEAAP
ncbi:hypothetical protein HED60_01265 [Planctomycetales bacterium ZRK34]|nr:hypothetical protein HED60_01265 [Planctomycetales bacterium ZRK34]